MDSGRQLTETAIFSEPLGEGGPALLAGFFLGFHVIVIVLAVWIFGASPQAGDMTDLSLNYLLLVGIAFACLGNARYGLKIGRAHV